jgi:hypothetical protein
MEKQNQISLEEMMEKLNSFGDRLNRIESTLRIREKSGTLSEVINYNEDESDTEDELTNPLSESKVFEYGLAWLGSAVLLLGMIFMMSLVTNLFGGLSSCFLGLAAAALTHALAGYLKKTFSYMAFMFSVSGHLLLYYSLMKLHFFAASPVIGNMWVVLSLMIAAIGVMFYLAVKTNSELMAVFAYLLLIITAIVSDNTNFTFSILVLGAATSIYLFDKCSWKGLLVLSVFLTYIGHTLWLIGNPVMGHAAAAVTTHQNNLFFLLLYGALYSIVPLIKQRERFTSDIYNAVILINGLAFSLVLMLIVLTFYTTNYIWIFLTLSIFCLIYSIILNYKIERKFDSSFYANFSFMALSIAVFGYANLPGSYVFLGWQSLVVLAMAIWFRSNLIVKMNTLLFSGILIAYLITAKPLDSYNFSFTLIAIISARILNWKKDRLDLKTDLIRNIYLVITFFSMLYTLYFAVPKDYVTMSWGLAAVVYMIFSVILKNVKYRLMAILTLLVTVFYLFMFDFSRMGIGYRIIAFIFVGLIILGVSFYYTKKLKKDKDVIFNNNEQT